MPPGCVVWRIGRAASPAAGARPAGRAAAGRHRHRPPAWRGGGAAPRPHHPLRPRRRHGAGRHRRRGGLRRRPGACRRRDRGPPGEAAIAVVLPCTCCACHRPASPRCTGWPAPRRRPAATTAWALAEALRPGAAGDARRRYRPSPAPAAPAAAAADFLTARDFLEPVVTREAIDAILAVLLSELCRQLTEARPGCPPLPAKCLPCRWRGARGCDRHRPAGARPTPHRPPVPRDTGKLEPGFGFERLALEARACAPLTTAQAALPGEGGASPRSPPADPGGAARPPLPSASRSGAWRRAPAIGQNAPASASAPSRACLSPRAGPAAGHAGAAAAPAGSAVRRRAAAGCAAFPAAAWPRLLAGAAGGGAGTHRAGMVAGSAGAALPRLLPGGQWSRGRGSGSAAPAPRCRGRRPDGGCMGGSSDAGLCPSLHPPAKGRKASGRLGSAR